jgi:hypothetical protein
MSIEFQKITCSCGSTVKQLGRYERPYGKTFRCTCGTVNEYKNTSPFADSNPITEMRMKNAARREKEEKRKYNIFFKFFCRIMGIEL